MKKQRQLNATRRDLLKGALGASAIASVISQAAKLDSHAKRFAALSWMICKKELS